MIWNIRNKKDATLKTIFRLIRDNREMTRSSLSDAMKIKPSTLSRAVDQLLQAGFIKEKGQAGSTGGRRPTLYEIEKNAGYMVGIDISRTYCSIVLVNLTNEVIEETSYPMDTSQSPRQVIDRLITGIHEFLQKHDIKQDQFLGIGIGTVGPINRETGYLLYPPHFPVPGWGDFSISQQFEDAFHVPVFMENGANTAAWAEFHRGGLNREFRNIAYTHIGIGIRCGIISEGRLVQGNNQEDAFGHTVVDIDGNPCSCGNYGCLETYCSIPSVVNAIKREIKKGRDSLLAELKPNIDNLTWEDVMKGLTRRDPLCDEVIQNSALYFGTGLANLINALHPEVVILGGPLVQYSRTFFEQTRRTAEKKIYRAPGYDVTFRIASLEKRSIALGAAILVLDHYLYR
ncbi:MAG: ROK family transcriptional regulator [Bacillaceae bacterium]|nr:ROK family transcriptional regulator [Bacillaceae bacterium]